jgi:hypothetical protein
MRDRKDHGRQEVAEKIAEMNQENHFIDSAAYVQKELKKEGLPVPKVNVVRNILKKDLGMSYRKVNPIAWTANSHRNLILR